MTASFKCEMNGTSQGGLYSVIWILILDPDYTDPQKQSVLLGRVGNMLPACLFVFTACLFVMRLACYGFSVCCNSSMTDHAKNVPDPMSCHDGHYDLSVTLLSCWGFHNRLSIFARFFP